MDARYQSRRLYGVCSSKVSVWQWQAATGTSFQINISVEGLRGTAITAQAYSTFNYFQILD
jgi:hypothetical protein